MHLYCTSGTVKNPLDLSEEEWNRVVRTNLTGTWLVSKYVCTRMRDANLGGSVVNISSIAAVNRGMLPGAIAYASSKMGVNIVTKVREKSPVFASLVLKYLSFSFQSLMVLLKQDFQYCSRC